VSALLNPSLAKIDDYFRGAPKAVVLITPEDLSSGLPTSQAIDCTCVRDSPNINNNNNNCNRDSGVQRLQPGGEDRQRRAKIKHFRRRTVWSWVDLPCVHH